MLRSAAKKKKARTPSPSSMRTRQGTAPWRGNIDAFVVVDFFLILEDAIVIRSRAMGNLHRQEVRWPRRNLFRSYFLNKLSNAARASLALRGPDIVLWSGTLPFGTAVMPSRATVTRGAKRLQSLAWSLRGMRTGTTLRH
jgi:hypothetical protein